MQKDLTNKFKNLPQDLKDAIFDVANAGAIQAIAKKYGLNIEQTGNLADEIGLLMLGETHPKDFVANLNKRLGADPETTKKVAQEVNEQIFAKVRESLKKIHEVSEVKPEQAIPEPKPEPVIPAPKPVSPFERKLEDKVFAPPKPPSPSKEVAEAKKENRYPASADPYREPPK